jgi:hypothetical protein
MSDVTQLLNAVTNDPKTADEIMPLVYEEFFRLAASTLAQQQPGQTLQATALVHEAWPKVNVSGAQRGKVASTSFALQRCLT